MISGAEMAFEPDLLEACHNLVVSLPQCAQACGGIRAQITD